MRFIGRDKHRVAAIAKLGAKAKNRMQISKRADCRQQDSHSKSRESYPTVFSKGRTCLLRKRRNNAGRESELTNEQSPLPGIENNRGAIIRGIVGSVRVFDCHRPPVVTMMRTRMVAGVMPFPGSAPMRNSMRRRMRRILFSPEFPNFRLLVCADRGFKLWVKLAHALGDTHVIGAHVTAPRRWPG